MGLVGIFAVLASLLVAAPSVPAPTTRVLNVAWHHQEHNLSCEAAALRMALSYYGIKVDELTLIRYMSHDTRPAQLDAAGHLVRWGDPARSYVGNPDGNIHRYQGYGVYFQPVAVAAKRAGASVLQAGSGLYGTAVQPADVYRAVLAGHPVVAWISNTYHQVKLSSYTSFGGVRVPYTLTEHAVTIAGVRPGEVLIDDPWFGRAWHPRAQFESAFRTFGGMAVVVGPS